MGKADDRMKGERSVGRARGDAGRRRRAREGARSRAQRGAPGAAEPVSDEPIRIPGADEYRAPEQFREDLLEAMKKKHGAEGYDDMVKRYYEELIK